MALLGNTIINGNLTALNKVSLSNVFLDGHKLYIAKDSNDINGLATIGQVVDYIQDNSVIATKSGGTVSWDTGWITAGSYTISPSDVVSGTFTLQQATETDVSSYKYAKVRTATASVTSGQSITKNPSITWDGTNKKIVASYTGEGTITGGVNQSGWVASVSSATVSTSGTTTIDPTTLSSDLIAKNIRAGTTIFGVVGTLNVATLLAEDSTVVNATSAKILTGYNAYSETGSVINGAMPVGTNITGKTMTIAKGDADGKNSADFSIPEGYYDGTKKVTVTATAEAGSFGATVSIGATTATTGSAVSSQYFKATPTATVASSGWHGSGTTGTAVDYKVRDAVIPAVTITGGGVTFSSNLTYSIIAKPTALGGNDISAGVSLTYNATTYPYALWLSTSAYATRAAITGTTTPTTTGWVNANSIYGTASAASPSGLFSQSIYLKSAVIKATAGYSLNAYPTNLSTLTTIGTLPTGVDVTKDTASTKTGYYTFSIYGAGQNYVTGTTTLTRTSKTSGWYDGTDGNFSLANNTITTVLSNSTTMYMHIKSGTATAATSGVSVNVGNITTGTTDTGIYITPKAGAQVTLTSGYITGVTNANVADGTTTYIQTITVPQSKTLTTVTNNGTIGTLAGAGAITTDSGTGTITNKTGARTISKLGTASTTTGTLTITNNQYGTVNVWNTGGDKGVQVANHTVKVDGTQVTDANGDLKTASIYKTSATFTATSTTTGTLTVPSQYFYVTPQYSIDYTGWIGGTAALTNGPNTIYAKVTGATGMTATATSANGSSTAGTPASITSQYFYITPKWSNTGAGWVNQTNGTNGTSIYYKVQAAASVGATITAMGSGSGGKSAAYFTTARTISSQYFYVTPSYKVGTAGWVGATTGGAGTTEYYMAPNGSYTANMNYSQGTTSTTYTTVTTQNFKIQAYTDVTQKGWVEPLVTPTNINSFYSIQNATITSTVSYDGTNVNTTTTNNGIYLTVRGGYTTAQAGWAKQETKSTAQTVYIQGVSIPSGTTFSVTNSGTIAYKNSGTDQLYIIDSPTNLIIRANY